MGPAVPDSRRAHLIAPAELRTELEHNPSAFALLDVRLTADRPDLAAYLAGHLPAAVFVDLDADLAGVSDGTNGQRPLPAPDALEKTLRRWGIDRDTPVVVYGAARSPAPARAWWLLRWAGVSSVRLLDGGFEGWVAGGGPIASGEPETDRPETDFAVQSGGLPVVHTDDVLDLAHRGLLLDARPAAKYSHATDESAVHIPGARSVPAAAAFGDDGHLKSDGELRKLFGNNDFSTDDEPATYCGTGVAAALDVLILALLGVRARLYVGSMSEWTADPSRPVER